MIVDDAGWLSSDGSPQTLRVPTARFFNLDFPEPLGVVWHTTDTSTRTHADSLAERIRELPANGQRSVSWHILIARSGLVFAQAPATVGTWHCGVPGNIGHREVRSINRASVGIEVENAGRIRQLGDGWYCHPYTDTAGQPDPRQRVEGGGTPTQVRGSWWEGFASEQVVAAEAVVRALATRFPAWGRAGFEHGHVDYDPDRREDPGPVWREQVLPIVLSRVFAAP